MDGNKGPVRALRRFNNSIISFQDKGISEVLFNSRTQLSTTEGVPIEIPTEEKPTEKPTEEKPTEEKPAEKPEERKD